MMNFPQFSSPLKFKDKRLKNNLKNLLDSCKILIFKNLKNPDNLTMVSQYSKTETPPEPDISDLVIEDDQDSVMEMPPEPDISDLVIEDDQPVDNFRSEKQQRLLTEALYSSWAGPTDHQPYIVAANVGVYYALKQPPLVPDVFLSLEVAMPADWQEKNNRTYFVWELGKPPDVVIEIVSNREGNELGSKIINYAKMRASYYVVFDPMQLLGEQPLQIFELRANRYEEIAETWLEKVGLGLTLWQGEFEGVSETWLRWCNRDNQVIPTGKERAETERQRAETAEERAERLAAQLRALGIDPEM
jgi:Uma2 family endonuclease